MVADTHERAKLWIEISTLRAMLEDTHDRHPSGYVASQACAEVLRGRYSRLEQLDRG